ncbi:hypothetical protein CPB86DRAFT_268772 [Serendipita vermifera]|nr:hypothetical protein CPB86DRAFT_268772 [Serendipita vermifera]
MLMKEGVPKNNKPDRHLNSFTPMYRGRGELAFAGIVGIVSAFYILKPYIDQAKAEQALKTLQKDQLANKPDTKKPVNNSFSTSS